MFQREKTIHKSKKQKALQAPLLLIEQMCEEVASDKYGITVFVDLQGAFDAMWRKGALYKLQKQVSLTIFSQFFPAFSQII